ncbi:MAG: PhoH family protein [Candidatus Wildermuthbacteria bacterium]|nr:PhoH family protein [Candidatus Wildermuthbacteria bacterium]
MNRAGLAGCTKIFVVDTSVFLHDPDAMHILAKDPSNLVVVPLCVIEELGNKRSAPGEIGFNAMSVVRTIDGLRQNGEPSLHQGVQIGSGKGFLVVDHDGVGIKSISGDLEETGENKILVIARNWQEKRKDAKVVIITKNIGMRLKADAVGISAEDYKNDKVVGDSSQLYSGVMEVKVAEDEMGTIVPLCSKESVPARMLSQSVGLKSLFPNQCLVLSYGEKYVLAVYKKEEGLFRNVLKPQKLQDGKLADIKPVNDRQAFLYWLLRDPTISCVTVRGKAGTGKSLISFLAGYEQFTKAYERLLIFKPVIEVGEQTLGFLPGDLQEKMEPWKAAIYDSLRLIVKEGKENSSKGAGTVKDTVAYYMQAGLMEIGPISFIRGRTFSNAFVIVDEAQNLTRLEVKALITRVGKGSKIVLMGDIDQIDNPYLDGSSNGLILSAEAFKGSEIAAHIELVRGERSELAELAARIM